MAATLDVQDVIDRAINRNSMNDADVIAGDAELIGLVDRVQQDKYLRVGQSFPDFFGAEVTITLTGTDEARFSDASPAVGVITRVEVAAESGSGYNVGDIINIVPTDEQESEVAPRMYLTRTSLKGVGTDLNGVTSVRLYYSIRPDAMDTTADPSTINMTMPDEFIDTIVNEVALYLAVKDNRDALEVQALQQEVADADNLLLTSAAALVPTTRAFNA